MAETELIEASPETSAVNTETSIDAPADNNAETANIEPDNSIDTAADTSEQEKTDAQPPEQEKQYAGKYKSIEEFEKGYKNLNAELTRLQQWQADIIKQQEAQNALRLEKAQALGFDSVEMHEISQRADAEEFNAYANAVNMLTPEYMEQAKKNLLDYYNTGNKAYLEEAKRYYPAELIERIALNKQGLISGLQNEYRMTAQKNFSEKEMKLAEEIKNNYAEFLSDIKENTGKASALKMFCGAGFIQSIDDMRVFSDIYSQIETRAKENAVKEYEAQKAVNAAKDRAVINADGQTGIDMRSMPTAQALRNTPGLYTKAVKKYGMDKIDKILMKG